MSSSPPLGASLLECEINVRENDPDVLPIAAACRGRKDAFWVIWMLHKILGKQKIESRSSTKVAGSSWLPVGGHPIQGLVASFEGALSGAP